MVSVKDRTIAILHEYRRAEAELVGRGVLFTDGKAGTVEGLTLDEVRGLRLSVGGHPGQWPVSTIKLVEKEGRLARKL